MLSTSNPSASEYRQTARWVFVHAEPSARSKVTPDAPIPGATITLFFCPSFECFSGNAFARVVFLQANWFILSIRQFVYGRFGTIGIAVSQKRRISVQGIRKEQKEVNTAFARQSRTDKVLRLRSECCDHAKDHFLYWMFTVVSVFSHLQ